MYQKQFISWPSVLQDIETSKITDMVESTHEFLKSTRVFPLVWVITFKINEK